MDEHSAGAARVTGDDLHRLVAIPARGSSCLGGLPIGLRAELSQTLHLLGRFLAPVRDEPRCARTPAWRAQRPQGRSVVSRTAGRWTPR